MIWAMHDESLFDGTHAMKIDSSSEMVIEIIMEDDPEWPGNQIYKNEGNGGFAKFCAEQDYSEHYFHPDDFYDRYFSWDFISKGTYFMHEDGIFTGVQLRWRNIHSLASEN